MHKRKFVALMAAAALSASRSGMACLTDVTSVACDCPDGGANHVIGGSCQSIGSLGIGGFPTLAGGGEGSGITDVAIQNFAFNADDIVIQPGTTVRWTNLDPVAHTSTRTGTWDSGVLSQAQMFTFDFTSANAGLSYDYFCAIHPFMTGVVRVARFGDANLDGNVNANDFAILATNFGQQSGGTWETGDFNGDGVVNANDFSLLATNFGKPIDPAGSFEVNFGVTVPEPGLAPLLSMLLLPIRPRARRQP